MSDKYEVLAVGNAIVDMIAQVEDSFLIDHDMTKGSMMLIDQARSYKIFMSLPDTIKTPGGSAGNTMACFASFGGRGAYIGKTGNDKLGQEFRDGMSAQNLDFKTPAITDGTPTAQCMIKVTPDAQRTMSTYLGAAGHVTPDDIDENMVSQSTVTYLEGYLFDKEESKKAFYKASELTEKHGKLLSLTLSDTFCVDRYREEFKDLVKNHIDILFANELELLSLYETNDFDEAIKQLQADTKIGAVTRSEKGSVIVTKDEIIKVDAIEPKQLVDTTGAGDSYAAGFLYGYTRNKDLAECGRLGSLAASEVISHMGPRPEQDLRKLTEVA